MRFRVPIYLGTVAVFLWLFASGYLRTSFGAYAYNESWILVLAFAIAATVTVVGERSLRRLGTKHLMSIASLDVLAGIACALATDTALAITLLCLHIVCDTMLLYCWCVVLSRIGFVERLDAICGSAFVAMVFIALCWNSNAPIAPILTVLCPAVLGIVFLLIKKANSDGAANGLSRTERDGELEGPSAAETAAMPPSDGHRAAPLLFGELILPGACLVCASIFIGIEATFVSNSYVVHKDGLIVVLCCIAFIWGSGRLLAETNGARKGGRGFAPRWMRRCRPNMFVLVTTALLTLMLITGLTLFSLQFAATFMFAIAFAMGVQAGSAIVIWVVSPRYIDSGNGHMHATAIILLTTGIAWATDLGISLIKLTELSYRVALNISTMLIAVIVVALVIVIAVFLGELLSSGASGAPSSIRDDRTDADRSEGVAGAADAGRDAIDAPQERSEDLSLESVYTALRSHQKKLLEPYELTKREEQIAMLLLDGQSIGSIAEQLVISERTVKFHCKNVYDKTGSTSKIDLIAKFVRSDDLIESEKLTPGSHEEPQARIKKERNLPR